MDASNESRVERLVAMARTAQETHDYEKAIQLIKQAITLAPLRSDLTRFLEELLEQSGSASMGDTSRTRSRFGQRASAQPEYSSLEPMNESAGETKPRFEGEAATPVGETAKELATEKQSAGLEKTGLLQQEHGGGADFFRPDTANISMNSPSSDPFATDYSGKKPLKTRKRRTPGTEEPGVLVNRQDKYDGEDSLDLFSHVAVGAEKIFQKGWSKIFSPRLQAALAIYSTIFVILITSSVITHRKFFAHRPLEVANRAQLPSTPSVTSENSSAPSSKSPQEDFETHQALKLVRDYIAQKRYEDATTLLENQLRRTSNPDLRKSIQAELARAYDLLGTSLLERNKLLQSLTAYEKAVKLAPEKPLYLLHLANAHYYCGTMLGDSESQRYLELADRELKEVLAADPRNLDAYQLQAALYEHRQNHAGAKEALTKIIELASPTSPEAKSAREKLKSISQAR